MLSAWGRRHNKHEFRLTGSTTTVSRAVGEGAREAFVRFRASSRRSFFPHRLRFLPKAPPDACRLSRWMGVTRAPDSLWEVVLHAEGPALEGLPRDLFFDRDIAWHGQHMGMEGHVAYASLARRRETLFALNYVSDLVQRISRRPDVRSRVENRFSGWADLLVNGVLRLAVDSGCRWLRSPTSGLAMRFTDPERNVEAELFRRVYDRTLERTLEVVRDGDWWVADVRQLADRLLPARVDRVQAQGRRRICVYHDTERGTGHRRSDPEFAERADHLAPEMLTRMLHEERRRGVHATYNVVANVLPEVRERIEADAHCVAFHSFDHASGRRQLARCREVDYRIRGYRPPQSRMTRELRDRSLAWYNVDWLATAESVLGDRVPFLEHRVVKIPILTDDYALYRDRMPFSAWAAKTLPEVREREFVAIGLHDCYGEWWTPHYGAFLEELEALGDLVTMDEVADDVFLSAAV